MTLTRAVLGITTLLAILRICGITYEAYQALAHIWVGLLFGAGFGLVLGRKVIGDILHTNMLGGLDATNRLDEYCCLFFGTGLALTFLVELPAAILTRLHP